MNTRKYWAIEYEDLKTIKQIIDESCETKEEAIEVINKVMNGLIKQMIEGE